jgi:hypothetical protein
MPIPAAIIGAGVSAAGNLLGNIFGNSGAKKRQEQANRDNIKFWNMQNEYNNPSSQMERLRKAGLNPNLIYGSSSSGASGQAQSIAPSKAAPYKMDNPLGDITQFANVKQIEATTDNLKAQNDVINQDALLKANQTLGVGQDNALKSIQLGIAPELAKSSLQIQQYNVKQAEAKATGEQLDTQFKSQTLKNRVMDIKYQMQNTLINQKGLQLKNEMLKWENELKELGLDRGDPYLIKILGRAYQNYIQNLKN